jgi:hypothetical protein
MSSTSKQSPSSASASRLLPCLDCRSAASAKALEEIAVDYLNYLRGERRLRFDDDRRLPYLPKACCKQAKVDVNAMVA